MKPDDDRREGEPSLASLSSSSRHLGERSSSKSQQQMDLEKAFAGGSVTHKPSFKQAANLVRVLTRWFEDSHQAPVFSVYLSCGSTDTAQEREYLMRWTYPEIRQLCANHGLHFDLVDNRWSLRDDTSAYDHKTAETCCEDIALSRETGISVSFLHLGTDKYGWKPPPAFMRREDFEAVLDACVGSERRRMRDGDGDGDDGGRDDDDERASATTADDDGNYDDDDDGDDGAGGGVRRGYGAEDGEADAEDGGGGGGGGRGGAGRRIVSARHGDKKTALEKWYWFDTNAKPPEYRLVPVHWLIPDTASDSRHDRASALREWRLECKRLTDEIETALDHMTATEFEATGDGDDSIEDEEETEKRYQTAAVTATGKLRERGIGQSVVEAEVRAGLLNVPADVDVGQKALCFQRNITEGFFFLITERGGRMRRGRRERG